MKYLHPRFALLLCLLFSFVGSANLYAQKEKKVHAIVKIPLEGKYKYMSLDQLEKECIKQAQFEAIKEAFGELIQSRINLVDASIDGEEMSNFYTETLISSTAEWLGDTKAPEVRPVVEDGKTVYIAEVWGRAREIEPASILIDWTILAGEHEIRWESDKFKQEQNIYIKFKAPCDGYLAIYLLDSYQKQANCLLPYKNNAEGIHRIQRDKEYILFDPKFDPVAFPYRYRMTTSCPKEMDKEMDQVVLLFSPNKFTKSNVADSDRYHPQSASIAEFEEWLTKLRRKHKELVVDRTKWITIFNQ